MAWETADWLIPNVVAAADMLPMDAAVRNMSSW
jgi:hypothetical protein